jgi:hypothetical protein
MGFDAGSFFKQFERVGQSALPPMPPQAAKAGAWGAVPGVAPR